MKKIIAIVLLIIPLLTLGQAKIGFRGAWGLSGSYISPTQYQKPVYGNFEAGFIINHFSLKYFGFQGELNISERGYRIPIDGGAFYKRVNTYIDLPIIMQGKVKYRSAYLILNAGCYAAFLVGSKEGDNLSGFYSMGNYDLSVLRDNRFDYGLLGGIGLGYDIRNFTLQVEARILYGYADVFKHSFEGNPMQSPFFAQTVSFGILYSLPSLKKEVQIGPTPNK